MTNDATRATAEGLPTERSASNTDPIIDVINAYEAGMAAYDGSAEFDTPEAEQTAINATYGPPLQYLENWNKPAITRAGAMAALRFAAKGGNIIGIDIQETMISAALAYFEQEGGESMSTVDHPLGFNTNNLPLKKLAALFDALTTLQNVTAGLMEQGLFDGDQDADRAAYFMMDSLRDKFGSELCSIMVEAGKREPATAEDAEAKFTILLMSSAWGTERPSEIVANIAKAAADIEWLHARSGRAAS